MDVQKTPAFIAAQDEAQARSTPAAAEETNATPRGRWYSVLLPWWQAVMAVMPIFLITRFIFLLLTYFGSVLFTVKNYSYTVVPLSAVLRSWYHWDVISFEKIALHDYSTADLTKAAFFPLYPWLERGVAALLHIHTSVFLAGMLISNLAFLGTLTVLYRFVEVEFDRDTARRAAFYLAIFPTALFFFAAYNESLFLFFMLLSFFAMRHRSWWLAGLFGGLATLTRSLGLALFVIFLYEFIRQVFPLINTAWREKRHLKALKLLSGLLAASLIPLALGIYAFYLDERLHDPLAFLHAQSQWHLGPTAPWYAPVVAIKAMLHFSPFTFSTTHNVIDLTALLLFVTLLALCFVGPERFAVSQWSMPLFGIMALSLLLIFPGTAYNPLPSMERYVLEIFPGFIMLARFGRRPWFHQGYYLLSLPLLAFLTLQFLTGHWTI
jgi:Gpi18-like mannosyltransferase